MKAVGIICDKAGIQYTVVSDVDDTVDEAELPVPASRTDRGDQLAWLLDEAEALFRRVDPQIVFVRKAGAGRFPSAPERHEVEGVVQIAAFRHGIPCELKTTDQLRAAAGQPKAKGAYEAMLRRPDVAARSNSDKRERYLYAVTALAQANRG